MKISIFMPPFFSFSAHRVCNTARPHFTLTTFAPIDIISFFFVVSLWLFCIFTFVEVPVSWVRPAGRTSSTFAEDAIRHTHSSCQNAPATHGQAGTRTPPRILGPDKMPGTPLQSERKYRDFTLPGPGQSPRPMEKGPFRYRGPGHPGRHGYWSGPDTAPDCPEASPPPR